MSNELIGDDFELLWDNASSGAGNYSTPTWAKQVSVGDIDFDTNNTEVEIPIRIGVKVYKKGRSDWTLKFTANYNKPVFNTIGFVRKVIDSINNGTKIHLAVSDGGAGGNTSNYWHAWWMLKAPLGAKLDNASQFEVEGKVHFDRGASDTDLPAYVPATA